MLLAAFMAVTSVGWTHAQGTPENDYEKTDDGYKVTTAAGFETVLGILNGESATTPAKITLAAGTYQLTQLAEVKKNLSVVGTDSTNCVINGKFRINGSGQQDISFNKVKINYTDTTISLTNPEVTLTLDAVAVYGSHCVKFNDYTATKAPTYIVKNSALHAQTHYALWTRSTGTYTWTIENSLLEGWAALYTSLGTPEITVSNSHLYSTNTHNEGTTPAYTNGHNGNGFATIVFENTQNGKVLLDNTDVKASWATGATSIQNSVIFQVWETNKNTAKLGATGNVVELKNGSSFWIEKPDLTPIFVYHGASGTYGSVTNNWVKTDGTATFKYGTDNLSAMVISNSGNIRTAVAPVQGGIDNMNSWTADGDVVTFPNAGSIDLTKQWVIQNAITLKGNKTSIQATGDAWPKNGDKITSSTANLISVEGSKEGTVTLEGLNILNSKAAGINAQSKMKTVLKDVTLKGNATAGLLVHSVVEATGLHTEGNVWGGVNIDKGTPEYSPSFTFDATSVFAEQSKIWSELKDSESAVKAPEGWYSYLGVQGTSSDEMRYWTNTTTMNVANANELKTAIAVAKEGGTIVLTGITYGEDNNIQSFGAVNVKNVTIKADKALQAKPKLYGTIQIMADGCTVEGLEFHTKGGSHPLKNAIDVVAMSVTIKNNDFFMTTPPSGSVGNGVTIWPYGDATTATYAVSGNSFKDFTGTAGIWNSTAFQIADACSLNEHFGQPYTTEISKTVTIANEQNYWTDNTFTNCDADYVHATWPNNAALYSFVALSQSSNNVFVLKEAVANATDDARIFVSGTYSFDAKLVIAKPISLTGVITKTDTTTFKATGSFSDNLISVEGVEKTISLSNLAIKQSPKYGLHAFNSKDVKLTSIGLTENKAGGLLVNGSTVTADKLTTENNAWGGIEVGKGQNVTTDPKLIISNSSIKDEKAQIWADTDPSKDGSVAEWVAGAGWNMYTAKKDGTGDLQTFWSQKTKIQINVTKSTFFYDATKPDTKYTVSYTTTPADVKNIVVTYYGIKDGKPDGTGTTEGKSGVGSYYAIFTRAADETYLALSDTVTMSINEKGVPVIKGGLLTPTAVEAGQPLSMSFLEGGKAVDSKGNEVLGTFAWADANMIMQEGDNKCAVVFTPANLAEMEVAVDTITIKAIRYFTVTTGVSANGKAVITNKSTSNRYPRSTTLNFAITPETGYEFTGWNDKTDHKETSYTVGQDTSFVADFTKKKFTVSVTAPGNNNKLTVKYKDASGEDQNVSSSATLDYGTVLTVTATADGDYNAESITSTGSTLSKGQIFLDANTTISATFAKKPEQPKKVTVTAPEGGTIRLTNKEDGKEIVAGSSVKIGTVIIIERTPNKGYKLADAAQARTEQTVQDNVTISATFEKEVYTITAKTGTGYKLSVDKSTGNYGDEVNVSYEVSAGYKAVALMVNAKEVPNNSTFTLTENTTVQAIVKEKATVAVNTDKQSYVYNSYNQAFVVKTTPAGLDSVSVSYVKNGTTVSTPIDAGTYTVQINRPEDENFKALNATATLEITKAPIVITARPSDAPSGTDAKGGAASVAGAWTNSTDVPSDVVKPMTKSLKSSGVTYAIYTPTSSNYSVGYCALTSGSDPTITIEQPKEGGTITVWEGSLQIASTKQAAKDVKLTAIATPAEGYKFSAWTKGIADGNKSNASAEVTPSENVTFAASFEKKADLTPSVTNASVTYDGTAKGGNLTISAGSVTTGWSYSFQQNGITVVPVNAGKYDVLVTRAADADNNACRELIRTAFEITKAKPNVTTKPAATVVKGAMLYSAEVTGGAASTDGTFVWKDADVAIIANATKAMTFVPSDTENFESVEIASVSVTASDAQVISFVQPENGTIIVKRGETVLASGDPIASGDVLTISAQPASGYELSTLTVAGAAFTNGAEYTVSGDATVNVVATMKKKSTGGSTPDPEPVAVSSVSLNKTELTLPRTESYTLVATINPSDASDKSVTWKSSDESVAKVDANGKVTALKVGTATITVTTVDGAKTATCEVTVDFATGLEEALANTQVYAKQGSIYVNPIQPLQLTIVNMLGKTVYNARISSYAQIPVTNGIYIVKLTNAGNTIVTKVNVY